jgi:hypothetical protein
MMGNKARIPVDMGHGYQIPSRHASQFAATSEARPEPLTGRSYVILALIPDAGNIVDQTVVVALIALIPRPNILQQALLTLTAQIHNDI